MSQILFPDSPSPGDSIVAPNGVTYTYDEPFGPGVEGVWLASAAPAPGSLAVTAGSISGPTALSSVLTYTQGVASGGTGPYTYTQQWYRDGVAIGGATSTSYTIVAADQGKSLTVTITATDSVAATATATTTPFAVPAASALSIVSAGTISGTPTSGSTLTYSVGSATGGIPTYAYTWTWHKASDNSLLQTGGTTYKIPTGLIGDNVYVTLVATDSTTPTALTATANTANYPSPGTITAGAFPSLVFDPASGPTASPASVNVAGPPILKGTATATGGWPAASPSPSALTVTGDIQIQINGTGGFVGPGGPYTITNGQSLEMIWNPSSVSTAAHGATLQGTISDGFYINTYSMVVDRSPDSYDFTDLLSQPLLSTVSSNVQTPTGFNVPISLFYTPGTNALGSVQADVGSGFVTLPTALPGLTVNPGDSMQIQGVTGTVISTTSSLTTTLGSSTGTPVTDPWDVTTTGTAPSVGQPSIATPTSGTGGMATSFSLTGTGYTSAGGAGPQASSDWQVYKAIPRQPETSAITAVNYQNYTSMVTTSPSPPVLFSGGMFASSRQPDSRTWQSGPGGSANWLQVDFTTPINVTTSLVVYATVRSSGNQTFDVMINGTTVTSGSNQWALDTLPPPTSVPFTGTMNSIKFQQTSFTFANYMQVNAIEVDGVILRDVGTTITFTNIQDLSSMSAGDSVVEITSGGAIGDASGVIGSINPAGPTIALSSSAGTWDVGSFVRDTTATPIIPPAPTTDPPNSTFYSQIVNVTGDASNLTSYPLTGLSAASTFYARVRYTSSTIPTTSAWSAWSSFATA